MAGADSPSTLAKLSLSVLDPDEETAAPSTIGDFRAGKQLILDFWHTRCIKCPAALTWLDAKAEAHPDITFASCALSLGSDTEGTQEQVHLLVSFDRFWVQNCGAPEVTKLRRAPPRQARWLEKIRPTPVLSMGAWLKHM